ncbi:MAG: hypothetical protein GC201_02205 [Alphaproteobacteria bacterium]|nr:hypothetical protein [Alphaproteobacteria bacterium]
MNDAPDDDDSGDTKQKRWRSPPYPMFDLAQAVERLSLMYGKARHHSVGVGVLAEAWGLKSGDGKVWRAAAALIQYGLLTSSGTGKGRKFQITDLGRRIVLDEDPNSARRKEAMKTAALKPMINNELWEKYKTANGLADSVIKSYLTLDRQDAGNAPYSPTAADEVLGAFRASLAYAGISDSDSMGGPAEVTTTAESGDRVPPNPINVKVGDFVKWTSAGVTQFDARQVEWISDDATHLRVIGSATGIPMLEVEKVDKLEKPSKAATATVAVDPPAPHVETAADREKSASQPGTTKLKNVTASVIGGRLQLSADVGVDEIEALKQLLTKYHDVLKMLN